MQPLIFNIQKFSINDGPGIRTTVFLKGCMLNCLWCHNPESKSAKRQLMFNKNLCIGCGECFEICHSNAHKMIGDKHIIEHDLCTACGKCTETCVGALEIVGKEMCIDEIIAEVLKDKTFYDNSQGGITLSGGEPLMHPEFTLELLKEAKKNGLHTCIETCGYVSSEVIRSVAPYVDIFLWDIKETDFERHKKYTGVTNERILNNLEILDELKSEVILRCPIITGYNDRVEHFINIGILAEKNSSVKGVEIEPYHAMGIAKCERLGMENEVADISVPDESAVRTWIDEISKHTSKSVRKA